MTSRGPRHHELAGIVSHVMRTLVHCYEECGSVASVFIVQSLNLILMPCTGLASLTENLENAYRLDYQNKRGMSLK